MFLRGGILRMLGQEPALPRAQARLAGPLPANDRREDYLRASYAGSADGLRLVETASRQDSSMFATFARADALVIRPPHDPPRSAGDLVKIIDLRAALQLPC